MADPNIFSNIPTLTPTTTNSISPQISIRPNRPTTDFPTYQPSNSPVPTPFLPHNEPHYWPPAYYSGYWYPPTNEPPPDPSINNDSHENSFIAFVGWYAFLLLCCIIPTACAIQRRRRNERIVLRDVHSVQRRLEELDRMGLEDVLHGRGGVTVDLGEDRTRDWEFLEGLFGGEGVGREGGDGQERRRVLLADIIGGMSLRTLMEREERRRRERGARLVAVLKETSLEVQESNLIGLNETSMDEECCQYNITTTVLDVGERTDDNRKDTIEIPIDSNCKHSSDMKPNCTSIDGCEDGGNKEGLPPDAGETFESSAHVMEDSGPKHEIRSDRISETADTDTTISIGTNHLNNTNNESISDQTHLPNIQQPNNSDPSALYQEDVPFPTHDEDNKYSALCIPDTNPLTPIGVPQSIPTRLVPPACAICLTQYEPGCYVSWSGNKECIHAFHRDCILMWLLKKEEPLCPCCRRDFIAGPVYRNGELQSAAPMGLVLTL